MDKSILFDVKYTIAVVQFKIHQGQIHGFFALCMMFRSLEFASAHSLRLAFRSQCARSLMDLRKLTLTVVMLCVLVTGEICQAMKMLHLDNMTGTNMDFRLTISELLKQ